MFQESELKVPSLFSILELASTVLYLSCEWRRPEGHTETYIQQQQQMNNRINTQRE